MSYAPAVAPLPVDSFPDWTFDCFEMSYDPESQAVWMSFVPQERPSFTPRHLDEFLSFGAALRLLVARPGAAPVRYVVIASLMPGIFNMGGDLEFFSKMIRDRDAASMRSYARASVENLHAIWDGFGLPVVTFSVVAGDAFGGGFETAMAGQFLVVEKSARMGLPEIAFNLFPGMGANSILSRRVGTALAERAMLDGTPRDGAEWHRAGSVDWLVGDGEAAAWTRDLLRQGGANLHARLRGIVEARRSVAPVPLAEMVAIVDSWAATAFGLTPLDIRYMDRLVAAQKKRMASA